jgi:hypothetical protein
MFKDLIAASPAGLRPHRQFSGVDPRYGNFPALQSQDLCYNWHQVAEDRKEPLKLLDFVGGSRSDLKGFPDEVRQEIGYAIYVAQQGRKQANERIPRGRSS